MGLETEAVPRADADAAALGAVEPTARRSG
jgi:hypothetical protein